jgi:hypothetical protein
VETLQTAAPRTVPELLTPRPQILASKFLMQVHQKFGRPQMRREDVGVSTHNYFPIISLPRP